MMLRPLQVTPEAARRMFAAERRGLRDTVRRYRAAGLTRIIVPLEFLAQLLRGRK